MIFAGLK
jgi:ribonucleoside-diphosphate reductase alpha subunit